MKTTGFFTALMMVLLSLSVILLLKALDSTTLVPQVVLAVAAIMFFSLFIWLWRKVQSQIRKEEKVEYEKRARQTIDTQALIDEVKGLRQDIGGLLTYLRRETTKHTKGRTP